MTHHSTTRYRLRHHPEVGLFEFASAAAVFALIHGLDPEWEVVS